MGVAVSSRLFSSSTVEALVLEPVKPPHPHSRVAKKLRDGAVEGPGLIPRALLPANLTLCLP